VTPEQAAMVDFLRQQYADGIGRARSIGNMLIAKAGDDGMPSRQAAERQAHVSLNAAETRTRFLEETVVPYLGTAGPTGRIADIQLRLLAYEHHGAHGYDESWRE
jgi:hypothetical protein